MRHNMQEFSAQVHRVRRPISIVGLLDWAFRVEAARLAFDDLEDVQPASFGMEYVMIERARLGCQVDGGGSSPCHPDADLVADAVAQLPEGCGGRQMALTIATHARLGTMPDWGQAVPSASCQPVQWKRGKHGVFAAREYWCDHGRWPPSRLGTNDGYACRVYFVGTAAEVAARRRNYSQWLLALLDLRNTFKTHNNLSCWSVTDALPDRRPWLQCHKIA